MNQRLNNAAHILIPHHAKNKLHPLPRIILIQRLAQCLRTIGIMSTIKNNIRMLVNALQATGPQRIGHAYMQSQLVNAIILLRNKLRSHNGHTGIFYLMLARQLNFIFRAIGIARIKREFLPFHGASYLFATEGLAIKIHRRFLEHSKAYNGPQSLVAFGRSNYGHLFLDNARLLHGNALHCGATAVRMV